LSRKPKYRATPEEAAYGASRGWCEWHGIKDRCEREWVRLYMLDVARRLVNQ
jgi:hypothetical protein